MRYVGTFLYVKICEGLFVLQRDLYKYVIMVFGCVRASHVKLGSACVAKMDTCYSMLRCLSPIVAAEVYRIVSSIHVPGQRGIVHN